MIGYESMKLQNWKKIFASNPEKKDTKTSTKRHKGNGMTQNGLFDILSNVHA